MKLDFIPLDRLSIAATNMRKGKKPPDISDILPTVRTRGIVQTLIVRPKADCDGAYEIIAGRRRYFAALAVAEEQRKAAGENDNAPLEPDPVPCAILDCGDDADAIEASLIENCARLDPDEVSRWEAFTALVRQGRGIEEISQTFGLPLAQVRRILALGNLLPRIREAYRREDIDASTVRQLTLASKAQQRAWLALFSDPDSWAPRGHMLKSWLFGGETIRTSAALFDLDDYKGAIVSDLFGEDSYFADAESFWERQHVEIDALVERYREEGWSDVQIVIPDKSFSVWDHDKCAKRKGGRVYIDINHNGSVAVHQGYVTRAEAKKMAKGEKPDAPVSASRPEISGPMATYVALHRHAAVRAELAVRSGLALRVMVAHLVCGSRHVRLDCEAQSTRHEDTSESVETSAGESFFDEKRRAVLALLGLDPDTPTVIGGTRDFAPLLKRLIDLPDPAVLDVLAIITGEALASGSDEVEAVGAELGTEMRQWWEADEAFFTLLRDREVSDLVFAEIAGPEIAAANAHEKAKTKKAIALDLVRGTGGRTPCSPWVPRWMAFPPSAYTDRGGVPSVSAHQRLGWTLEAHASESVEVDEAVKSEAGTGETLATVAAISPVEDISKAA